MNRIAPSSNLIRLDKIATQSDNIQMASGQESHRFNEPQVTLSVYYRCIVQSSYIYYPICI